MALQKKPPVVTIMGHVDHGKTSLLDYIRKTKLVSKEFGEITQAIGAYQIEIKGQKITFIDTPGHEAFSKMRYRGASVADIVVLVIAAGDGVMQQTKESIKIVQEAKLPLIVAISKIDLPGASTEKLKTQLSENGVFVEGYGGSVVAVPISSKTGEGIDQLLEMILLTAEMEELKADPEAKLEAIAIESRADKFCGFTATLIVKNGTLRVGNEICIENSCSKVKMLKDEWGKSVAQASAGDPVLVLGFSGAVPVGALVLNEKKEPDLIKAPVIEEKNEGKSKEVQLKIFLKVDVSGSLEAILACMPKDIEVVRSSVSEIKESDLLLAKTLGADVYGFNLSISANIQKLAETERVRVKTFKIIYDLVKDLEERKQKINFSKEERKIFGKAEILAVFDMKDGKVAGAVVKEGKINKNVPILIQRGEKILGEGKIVSLKQQKQDINEVENGTEFGAIFSPKLDFQKGDVLISFSLEKN